MPRFGMKYLALAAGLATCTASAALAFVTPPPADAPARLEVSYDGFALVTPEGRSLYMNTGENVKSDRFSWNCTNVAPSQTNDQQSGLGPRPQIGFKLLKSCIQKFPPYLAGADAKPVGEFGVVARPDGSKQWTYKNFPLYFSAKDLKPGQRNGPGGGSFGGRGGGLRLATLPVSLPTGLKLSRREEGLVLASEATDRPLYTPQAGTRVILAGNGKEEFRPVVAPAIASVNGEWSIIEAGAGRKQYAFRNKPLYSAPAGMSDFEIIKAGGWDPVVVVKGPGVPSAIGKQLSLLGDVYTDKRGMTLYTYNCNAGGGAGGGGRVQGVSCDEAGDPAAWLVAVCGDAKECARRWKPYIADANAKPEGDFSIVDITYPMFTDMRGTLYPADAPKVKAWAYRGNPLFLYYEDEKPGHIWGNNMGGLWGSSFGALQVPGRSAIFE